MPEQPSSTASKQPGTSHYQANPGAVEHGFDPIPNEVPFTRFGILLPILMLSLIPTLILLAVAKSTGPPVFFSAVEILALLLIFGSSVILIASGIMGAIEYAQYRRTATGPRR